MVPIPVRVCPSAQVYFADVLLGPYLDDSAREAIPEHVPESDVPAPVDPGDLGDEVMADASFLAGARTVSWLDLASYLCPCRDALPRPT